MLSRFPDVLTQTAAPTNEDELWEDVRTVAEQAVDAFVAMRAVEGEKMKADVAGRLTTIETLVAKIEENSAGRVQAYSDKLYARLQELLGDRSIDEGRLVTEAAIFADKTAIDEETVRLHSHVAQYREILELDEPIGRKLDFLTQELNRESNTIGSKCQDVAITRLVVELKSEIGKNSRADSEHRVTEVRHEAAEHWLWQHGQCRPHHRHRQPGFCAYQASGAGCPRKGRTD